jgi:hypothetical protein
MRLFYVRVMSITLPPPITGKLSLLFYSSYISLRYQDLWINSYE